MNWSYITICGIFVFCISINRSFAVPQELPDGGEQSDQENNAGVYLQKCDANGTCSSPTEICVQKYCVDLCKHKNCGVGGNCVVKNKIGSCECNDKFTLQNGTCIDPCATVKCQKTESCAGGICFDICPETNCAQDKECVADREKGFPFYKCVDKVAGSSTEAATTATSSASTEATSDVNSSKNSEETQSLPVAENPTEHQITVPIVAENTTTPAVNALETKSENQVDLIQENSTEKSMAIDENPTSSVVTATNNLTPNTIEILANHTTTLNELDLADQNKEAAYNGTNESSTTVTQDQQSAVSEEATSSDTTLPVQTDTPVETSRNETTESNENSNTETEIQGNENTTTIDSSVTEAGPTEAEQSEFHEKGQEEEEGNGGEDEELENEFAESYNRGYSTIKEETTKKEKEESFQFSPQPVQIIRHHPMSRNNNEESSSFPVLFMASIVIVVGAYFVYHNRVKLMALVIEGRSSAGSNRRGNSSYQPLKTVEDAMPSVTKHTA